MQPRPKLLGLWSSTSCGGGEYSWLFTAIMSCTRRMLLSAVIVLPALRTVQAATSIPATTPFNSLYAATNSPIASRTLREAGSHCPSSCANSGSSRGTVATTSKSDTSTVTSTIPSVALVTTTLSGGGTVFISSTAYAGPHTSVISNAAVASTSSYDFLFIIYFLLVIVCALFA
ncbi:hypothetical protein CERSUDRAFT_118524 [Gelatoporia subvermispora B]|uniref:Uncharacterized protein n=1 Tax=Ceriporiopsis subvermispora (strain B) TaxID=914234 RepID=M2PB99_CERS8|nr:hypothetical protein CERSUDRAFT_118524 [Gelatoporia subvermispora B]